MDIPYLSGFGNSFASEAVPGALPPGRNSPQRAAHGLYAEVLSGTAFTAPRAENHSTWLYKLRPSAMHGPYRRLADGKLRSGPFNEAETAPNRLRWNPFPIPGDPADFVDGLLTIAGSGDPADQTRFNTRINRHVSGRSNGTSTLKSPSAPVSLSSGTSARTRCQPARSGMNQRSSCRKVETLGGGLGDWPFRFGEQTTSSVTGTTRSGVARSMCIRKRASMT